MKKWPKFLDFEFFFKSKILQRVLVGSQIREGFLIFKMIQIWKRLTGWLPFWLQKNWKQRDWRSTDQA
jgi:hypothetical protein